MMSALVDDGTIMLTTTDSIEKERRCDPPCVLSGRENQDCVFFLNNISGCETDIIRLGAACKELGFECTNLESVTSFEELTEKTVEHLPGSNASVIVFFFGYGYDDYMFLTRDESVCVSYKKFLEAFSPCPIHGGAFMLFTNVCFKYKEIKILTSSENPRRDIFHVCVQVNGQCKSGSLLTTAVLKVIKERGTNATFFDFVQFVTNMVEKLQEEKESLNNSQISDEYICETRYQGVCGSYYFNIPQKPEAASEPGFATTSVTSMEEEYPADSTHLPEIPTSLRRGFVSPDILKQTETKLKSLSIREESRLLSAMTSPMTSVYSLDVQRRIRLIQMCNSGFTKALQILLEWLTPGWDRSNETFFDYMKRKTNVTMREFNRALKPIHKDIMKRDPEGSTWDVSLLFVLILYGNEFLADRNDPVWKIADTHTRKLEFFIKRMKNLWNHVVHYHDAIDEKRFRLKTEEIRTLINETIEQAGLLCKHVKKTEITKTIIELELIITQYRDDFLESRNFCDYKKQLLFQEQRIHVETKGKLELYSCHSKYNTLNPSSLLVQVNIPVEDVFTQMVLEGDDEKINDIKMEDILLGDNHLITNDIILMEGGAGVGKTTLVKKILSDWVSGKKAIKGLDQYSIILHAECREYVESLKQLLTYSMPDVSRNIPRDDLLSIMGDLNSIIIIDGLDELNSKSTKLFRELLNFKYNHDNMTLLVTTRPEALSTYHRLIDSNLAGTKHIRILGIPSNKRKEFVQKYYESIEKLNFDQLSIERLVKYFHRTDKYLGHLWRSPYNITLLVILGIMKPNIINSITTSSELNWEIFLLYMEKLEERLRENSLTQHLLPSILKRKIELFLYNLCEETLGALADNSINLDEEAFRRLVKLCHDLEIPEEDMLGMFLTRLTSASTSTPRYSFPNKGTMDFMAARYIFMKLTDTTDSLDDHNLTAGIEKLLSLNAVPVNIIQGIMKETERMLKEGQSQCTVSSSTGTSRKGSSLIEDIIKKAESSEEFQMEKYQNLFINLIGLFHLHKIDESFKKEALTLLQKTGIRNKEQWIELLNGVKCDQYVVSLISKETGVLDGRIEINDSSLCAYISLLQALDSQVQVERNLQININIQEGNIYVNDILEEINKRNLNVTQLSSEYDFRHPASPIMNSDAVSNIMKRCQLSEYKGSFHQIFQETQYIERLDVSIKNLDDYESLRNYLNKHTPRIFGICLSSDMETHSLKSLPQGLGFYGPDCYVCEMKIQNMENSAEILSKIQPEDRGFSDVYFPRCFLKETQHYVSLIETLMKHHIGINGHLIFPESLRPSSEERQQIIKEEAKRKLRCSVSWNLDLNDW